MILLASTVVLLLFSSSTAASDSSCTEELKSIPDEHRDEHLRLCKLEAELTVIKNALQELLSRANFVIEDHATVADQLPVGIIDEVPEKRKNEFIRFGKRKNEFIRFGKRKNEFIRFGKRKNEFIRFGRSGADLELDAGEKRKNEFIRFG